MEKSSAPGDPYQRLVAFPYSSLRSRFAAVAVQLALDFEFLLGDVNCDGVVTLLDVGPFVDAITSGIFNPKADINGDGTVDLLDIDPFVNILTGG